MAPSRRLRSTVVALSLLAITVATAPGAAATDTTPVAAATVNPDCGNTVVSAGGQQWQCVFDDEFNGDALDTSTWVPVTSAENGSAGGDACFIDRPSTIREGEGRLHLTVRARTPFLCGTPNGGFRTSYVSGQVATYGTFDMTYGRVAIRAKFPDSATPGLQSALWMWPQNNILTGLTGEIDIAENYSSFSSLAIPTLHYALDPATIDPATDVNTYTNFSCDITPGIFHRYVLVWGPHRMQISIDGHPCLLDRLRPLGLSPFDQPYFIALTQALGIDNNTVTPDTPLPATTVIDWVRAYERPAAG